MARKTTDHRGRIINVNRSQKQLPPYPDQSIQVASVTQGYTIKMERQPDALLRKANQKGGEKFHGQIVCGDHDSDDEPKEDAQTGNKIHTKAPILDNRDL